MKRLVLIDGHAILHRAYHAFPQTLTTRKGELVNAVYGFTRILLKVITDLQPLYLAVAFDLPKPTFRHKEFIGYQAQRPRMDQELAGQVDRVNQVLTALNIPVFTKEGFEADDLIGTLSLQAIKKKLETIIVTGDRDLMQLVDQRTKIYLPVKGLLESRIVNQTEVRMLLGIKPSLVIDFKALVGDPSDNYPGVSGIGPKTAVKLLMAYGSLRNIYKNIDKVPEPIRQKLQSHKDSAYLSQKLATIIRNVPIKLDLKSCRIHDYDQKKVIELFTELEFKSLIIKLPGLDQKVELIKPKIEQTSFFR